jgi:hypothetical protein
MIAAIAAYAFAWFFLGAPDFDLHDYRSMFEHVCMVTR